MPDFTVYVALAEIGAHVCFIYKILYFKLRLQISAGFMLLYKILYFFNFSSRRIACSVINVLPLSGGMACKATFSCGEINPVHRLYLKQEDPELYSLLNYVYNNNREYLNSDTSTCNW